jgi:hypothetical protein
MELREICETDEDRALQTMTGYVDQCVQNATEIPVSRGAHESH